MTDLATLGLAIDSSPASRAASDLDRLTASAVKVERAVNETGNAADRAGKKMAGASSATKQMEAAINGSVHANDNAAGAINRHVAAINKLTEAERRLSASFGRGQDIAAYGAELDRLRGKFNPLFATIQQYKAAQAEIRDAHSVGAISASEMTAAIRRERQATLASIASLKGRATSLRQVAAAERSVAGARGFETVNIAAQFHDIGVTAAMGMNPLQIALQQGTQLASVLNSMDRPLTGLLGGFGSLLSITSLLTIALVAAGAAALQWLFSAKDDADKLDDALENHTKTVGHLTKLYGEAAAAAENLASAGGEAFSFASIRNDAETLRNVLKMQQQVMAQSLSGDGWLTNMLGGAGASLDMLRNLTGDQIRFKGAVDSLLESVRRGDGDMDGFRQNVETIFSTLLNSSENPTELRATADAVLAIGESATTVSGKFAPFSDAINKLMLEFSEGKNGVVEFNREVSRIGAQDPSLQKIADEAIVLGQNINKVTEALKEMERARFRATEQVRDRLASERNDTGQSYYQERERQWELENRILDAQTKQVQALTDQERIAAAGAVARARNPVEGEERRREIAVAERQERERLDQQARESAIDRAREREEAIRGAQEEMDLIGKTVGEVARLQYEYREMARLREEAGRTGRAIDEAEIASIRMKSEEMGRYAEETAAARAMNDIAFEREQLGRSREEQEVYAEIRRLGLDINSARGKQTAEEIRITQEMREQRTLADDLARTFSDLFSGPIKDADEFFSKLTSGFARIAQANIDKFFENMFSGGAAPAFGGAKDSTAKSGFLDQIGDWLDGIFTNRKVVGAQNKAIATASSQIPTKPLVSALSSVGGSISKVTASIGVSVEELMAGIKHVESRGRYNALGPVTSSGDRAYGAYQVMGNNIPSWTKELTGTSSSIKEFLRDTSLQDRVAFQQLSKSLDKFGNWQDAASVWFSGQPLAKARTRSDGYNTTQQYVGKVGDALGSPDTIQSAVKVGAKTGVETGITSVANNNVAAGAQNPGAQGGVGGMSGMGGALNSLLGGFGLGFQSENAAMGGIGGAISGFQAFGLPGAILGGIAGIFGGLFGRSRRKRQERDQAKAELESQMGAIRSLIDTAMGTPSGEYEGAWRQMSDEIAKARKLASKAGNSALVKELDAASETFFDFLVEDWRRGLDGVMEAMESGHGLDGAFVRAQKGIVELQDTLVGFVKDAKFFAETGGDYSKAKLTKTDGVGLTTQGGFAEMFRDRNRYDPVPSDYRAAVDRYSEELKKLGIEAFKKIGPLSDQQEVPAFTSIDALMKRMRDLGVVFDDLGNILTADQVKERLEREKELQRAIQSAQEAAQQMALRQLTGAEEFTAIETEIQRLQGTAAGLQTTLEKLGMTAEEAADAIEKGLSEALEKLKTEYVKDLTRSLNELSGAGYINDVTDAMKLYEERLKDSKALGLDTSMAFAELTLSLREISREAGLSGDDLKYLAKLFPDLAKILKGISPTGGMAEAQAEVDRAKADLRAAYDEEARAIETTISRLKTFIGSIEKFKASLRLDDQLSPLSPFDKLIEAQKRFEDVSAKALAGDETAMNDLEDVSRQYLEEARAYYASSEQYFAIFEQVEAILDQALASAKGQLSSSEQQLVTLKDQVSKLIDIDNSVMTVAAAIAALHASIDKLEDLGGKDEAFDPSKHWSKSLKGFYEQLQAYKTATKTDVVPDQIAGVWSAFASAGSGAEYDLLAKAYAKMLRDLMPKSAMRFGGVVGAYADGGIVGNGIYDRDSVIARYAGGGNIALAGGEFVTRATSVNARTASTLDYINRTGAAPGNDNSAVVAELRALRAEVAALKAGQTDQSKVVAACAQHVANAVEGTTQATAEVGRKIGQQGLRRPA